MREPGRTAVVMTSHPGQISAAQRAAEERAGLRPRRGPSEVAAVLDADLIDVEWLDARAHPLARLVRRLAGVPAAQIAEVVLRRRRYDHVCAWADRIGLPLALLFKVLRAQTDLTLVSVDLLAGKKALFFSRLRIATHLRAIQSPSSVQIEAAVRDLHVPRDKLVFEPKGVDSRFWHPRRSPAGRRICAVGWEARDYPTLLAAVRGLDVEVHVAVGTVVFSSREQGQHSPSASGVPAPLTALRGTAGYDQYARSMALMSQEDAAAVVWHQQLDALALRDLYDDSAIVVVPLLDVPFDAGATAIHEAMAMGRPVVATRTRGQVDLLLDGVTGVYVEPGDVDGLRRALRRLLDHPGECERMGAAGRARATSHFAFDRFVERTAALVEGRPAESETLSA
jgi:glycosyltransferase involved in cell wall biosynthesis